MADGLLELELEVPIRDFPKSGRYRVSAGLMLGPGAGILKVDTDQHDAPVSLESDEVTITIE